MRRVLLHLFAALILIGCWLVCFAGPLSYAGAFAPFVLALFSWRWSRGWALAFALANPLILGSVLPITSYFRGTAALGFHGLPGHYAYNLDRETRLPRRGGGCVIDGDEWLFDDWNNTILKACVKVFGPMRGTPQGPYPSEADLLGEWEGAREQKEADLAENRIVLEGKTRTFPGLGKILEYYAPYRVCFETPPAAITAKDFGGDSFALRIPLDGIFMQEPTMATVLFGGEPTQVMGYFAPDRGRSIRLRIPPVIPGR